MSVVIDDASVMKALGRQMTRAVQRESVAAGNLANLDTPGYHTKEVTFSDALDGQLDGFKLAVTDPRHLGAASGADPKATTEAAGLSFRRDGNNVSLDRELLSMSRATADFSAAETVLAAKFRLVRYAINEGR